MTYSLEFKWIMVHSEKEKEGMHQDISELKTLFINHQWWHWIWKPSGIDGLKVEFRNKICVDLWWFWNEGHVWMLQSLKQIQVWLIPNNDKPQTIGDAQPVTLLNADYNMHSWSKRNLFIHNRALIGCTMILPTVDHVLSAAPAPTWTLCLLEKNITQFLWDGPDGNRWHPMVDRATLARPYIHGGLNCPLVKDIADSLHKQTVFLWIHSRCSFILMRIQRTSFSASICPLSLHTPSPISFRCFSWIMNWLIVFGCLDCVSLIKMKITTTTIPSVSQHDLSLNFNPIVCHSFFSFSSLFSFFLTSQI